MWDRKKKVYKYFISKMVCVGSEKNRDPRCGPDMIDIYERCHRECSKEIYEQYSHDSTKETYTYKKYVGEEYISPETSYDKVKYLLKKPIEEIKVEVKSDILWAIKAIDVLVDKKKDEKWCLERETKKYTKEYIATQSKMYQIEIDTLKDNKVKLQNIYNILSNRKNVRLEKKRREEENFINTLNGVETTCECGVPIYFSYHRCFCGSCGTNVENLWVKTYKQILRENKKKSIS